MHLYRVLSWTLSAGLTTADMLPRDEISALSGGGRRALRPRMGDLVQGNTMAEPSLSKVSRHGPLEARNMMGDIAQTMLKAGDCTACHGVLKLLKGAASMGDKMFVKAVTKACKMSKAQDDDVCKGAVKREGPIIAQALRKMEVDSQSAQLFCITFMGLCAQPDVTNWTVPFPSEKVATNRSRTSGQPAIKVVHYSDVHIDRQYEAGASTNCTKPICCHSYTESDAPGRSTSPAGPNGDHKCDTPPALEQSMYDAIRTLVPDAALALFTGDVVDHTVWNTTKSKNKDAISQGYAHMGDGLPYVFGTAGNHEVSPTNAFAPVAVGNQSAWVLDALGTEWARWIGDNATAADSTVRTFGGYSTRVPDGAARGLRVISLNTNLYYVQNYYLYEAEMEKDPSGQLAWLVKELDAAERANETVYMLGHMPMGLPDAFRDASNYFDQIVNRYSDTIAAMFFGHTHYDHFQLSYADYGANRSADSARAVSYIAPSLTPTSGMPAFRVYSVDPVTFTVLDATTYTANMTTDDFQTSGPKWQEYYSAKATYGALVAPPLTDGAAELSPAFWHNVTDALEKDRDVFAGYWARRSRGWDGAKKCDDDECRRKELCQLRAGRAQDNCFEPTPGLHLSKVNKRHLGEGIEVGNGHQDECGVGVVRATLSGMVARGNEHVMRGFEEDVGNGGRGLGSDVIE